MKPILTAILIFTFLTLQPARADSPGDGRLGAGVVIGSPTALTGKYWTASDQAIDFGISFSSYRWTMLYGDYHWYWPEIFGHKNRFVSQLSLYVGVGGGLTFWSERRDCSKWVCERTGESGTAIFARVPVGVEWYPTKPPLGVFVEIVPSFTILPGTSGFFDVGVGIRYYF